MKKTFKVGDKVTFCSSIDDEYDEKGIIKSIPEPNSKYVFVVYCCGEKWENYMDYTAARTHVDDLALGWEKGNG
jgi:hypothetical protein